MADETREEREARWWRDWFAADYSWDGLAQKPIRGGGQFGEVTLQDYWRRDPDDPLGLSSRSDEDLVAAGELVEFDGRWWHLAHLPLRGRSGVESWKADRNALDWVRLNALLAARLAAATQASGRFGWEPGTYVWIPEGRDRRARFDGAVLGAASVQANRLTLSCRGGAFVSDLELSGTPLGAGSDFSSVLVHGRASFNRATFSGLANFGSAIFSGDVLFCSATFSSEARFDSATFSGEARFDRATFSGTAHFQKVIFSGDSSFDSATFSGGTHFLKVTFSGTSSFDSATFSGIIDFLSANFLGSAIFDRAIFSNDAIFIASNFSGDATFDGAAFKAQALLSGAFQGKTRFHGAVFEGAVTFSAAVAMPERDFARAFYGARFAAIADFSGVVGKGQGGRMAAAFAEAQFEKALILTDGLDGKKGAGFHKGLLQNTDAAAAADLQAEIDGLAERKPPQTLDDAAQKVRLRVLQSARLATLESGCRVVKIAMGKARDEVREQAYYRLQLRARQQRSDIDGWEKAVGWLYGVSSDFGSSLWRPLLGLGVLVSVFAIGIYWPWMSWLNIKDAEGPGGVFVALNQSLRTLSPFNLLTSPGVIASTGAPASLFEVNPAVTFGARIVSGAQSILSTLLIFLFGLAVKRRFQIS